MIQTHMPTKKYAGSVAIATHMLAELEPFMDKALCMKQGCILDEVIDIEALREEGLSLQNKAKEILGNQENGILELL